MFQLPSAYFHGNQHWTSPWGYDPHSMNFSTQAPLVVGNVNRFLAGKCFSLKISVMNSLCFPFLAPVAEFPSEFLQFPTPYPHPDCEVIAKMWKVFLLQDSLPRAQAPILKSLSLFYLFLLAYLILSRLTCVFGKLEFSVCIQQVFCESYSTCRFIFDVYVGRR